MNGCRGVCAHGRISIWLSTYFYEKCMKHVANLHLSRVILPPIRHVLLVRFSVATVCQCNASGREWPDPDRDEKFDLFNKTVFFGQQCCKTQCYSFTVLICL